MNSKLVLAVIVILLLLYVIFKALTTTYTTLGKPHYKAQIYRVHLKQIVLSRFGFTLRSG